MATSFGCATLLIILPLIQSSTSLPVQKTTQPADIEYYLDEFLRLYYSSYVVPGTTKGSDIINNVQPEWWEMQGDQPISNGGGVDSGQVGVEQVDDQGDRLNGLGASEGLMEVARRRGAVADGSGGSATQDLNMQYMMKMRKRLNESGEYEERAKDNWIQLLKQNILKQVGWTNYSTIPNTDVLQSNPQDFSLPNKTTIMDLLRSNGQENGNTASGPKFEGLATEKIRSYYPQCDVPKGADSDLWKDENILNLYYNIDVSQVNVQAANLRLYRLINETAALADVNCEENSPGEDEKILRVSAYWYLKPLKKLKVVKKRMCDSKVVSEKANWIELNIKPAMANWLRGRNAGLAIVVEDQDGGLLKADQYFSGPSCQTGGASTPKPIPSFILDVLRQPYDPSGSPPNQNSAHSLLGQDARAAFASHATLRLPSLDVKTSEAEDHQQQANSRAGSHLASANIAGSANGSRNSSGEEVEDCDSAEKHRTEGQSQAGGGPRSGDVQLRHTRHHHRHQHHKRIEEPADPRNRMVATQIIWTNQELMDLQLAHQKKNQKLLQEGGDNNSGLTDR